MITLDLSKDQVDDLLTHYNGELSKLNAKTEEVENVILQLKERKKQLQGEDGPENVSETPKPKKRGRGRPRKNPPKEKKKVKRQKTEEEIKAEKEFDKAFNIKTHDWDSFVLDTLKREDQLLTAADLVLIAIEFYGLENVDKIKVSRKISPVLIRLFKEKKIGKQRFTNTPKFYYGMPEWFMDDGQVKAEYAAPFQELMHSGSTEKQIEINEEEFRKFEQFVKETLEEQKKLLVLEDFIKQAKEKYDFSYQERRLYATNIYNVLKKLFSEQEVRRLRLESSKDPQYALPEWFKTNGELKESFK